jgi:copper transport protein
LLVLATAGAALLTSAQPAREPQFVRDSAPPVVAATDAGVADLQETLAVRPNLPGRNLVLVDVFDTRRPAPAPISAVTVAVDGGPAVAAQQLGGGGWSVPVVIGSSGSRRLHVSVVRVGMPVAAHDYRWTVRGGPLARRATVSNAPIAGPLRVAAGSLAAGIALAVSVSIASARRRRRGPDAPAPATAETPDNVLVDA